MFMLLLCVWLGQVLERARAWQTVLDHQGANGDLRGGQYVPVARPLSHMTMFVRIVSVPWLELTVYPALSEEVHHVRLYLSPSYLKPSIVVNDDCHHDSSDDYA